MEIILIAIFSGISAITTVFGLIKMCQEIKKMREELLLSKYRILIWDDKTQKWVEMPQEAILGGRRLAEGRQGFGLITGGKQAEHVLDKQTKTFYLSGKGEKVEIPK